MHVSEILKRKGSRVFTIRPRASVTEAVRKFRDRKIGAIPVREPGAEIVGLLTERDVLHGTATHAAAALDMRVEELMSPRIHTCTPDDLIPAVMGVMTREHVRHLLVVAGGELKGIISIGDIMRERVEESQLEVDVLRDYTRIHP